MTPLTFSGWIWFGMTLYVAFDFARMMANKTASSDDALVLGIAVTYLAWLVSP